MSETLAAVFNRAGDNSRLGKMQVRGSASDRFKFPLSAWIGKIGRWRSRSAAIILPFLVYRHRTVSDKTDPESDWPFDQGPNVAAITTVRVLKDNFPILNVTHFSDDDSWAFLCGTTNDTEDGRVIGMQRVLELDPTLRTIADLPPGWTARRQRVGSEWHRSPNEK